MTFCAEQSATSLRVCVLLCLHISRMRTQSCSGLPMAARVAFAANSAGSEEALKSADSATRDSWRRGPGSASCSGASSPAPARNPVQVHRQR